MQLVAKNKIYLHEKYSPTIKVFIYERDTLLPIPWNFRDNYLRL